MLCDRHNNLMLRHALVLTSGCPKCEDIEFKAVFREVHEQCRLLWTRGRPPLRDVLEDLRELMMRVTVSPMLGNRTQMFELINRSIKRLEG